MNETQPTPDAHHCADCGKRFGDAEHFYMGERWPIFYCFPCAEARTGQPAPLPPPLNIAALVKDVGADYHALERLLEAADGCADTAAQKQLDIRIGDVALRLAERIPDLLEAIDTLQRKETAS